MLNARAFSARRVTESLAEEACSLYRISSETLQDLLKTQWDVFIVGNV